MEFYDYTVLSKGKLAIDALIQKPNDLRKVSMFRSESRIWKGLFDVTPEIVDAFAQEAREHLRQIRANPSVYGYLYFVADHSAEWHTAPHFDYLHFPLMKNRKCVLDRIRKMAEETSRNVDATCLYLLYFYALIVNPSLNWITVDYLSNGNRYHPFGTRLKGQMKVITKKVWV